MRENGARWVSVVLVCLGLVCVGLLCPGCGPPARTLIIDVRTDYVPLFEFDAVRVQRVAVSSSPLVFVPQGDENFLEAVRVAQIDALEESELSLQIALELGSEIVAERMVRASLDADQALRIAFTRDCAGVSCESPSAPYCLGGRCVSARCLSGEEADCAGQCEEESDCPANACASGVCTAGVCFQRSIADACGEDAYCADGECRSTAVCGDGSVGGDEQCDGNTTHCVDLGLLGTDDVLCDEECRWDSSECVLPVLPGAYGFGTETPAGRGGRVIVVTNLNDSGPGSLREAIRTSGPRTVVFATSGAIELQSELRVTEGNLTLAGQTAPEPGIELRGSESELTVAADDVLISHLRLRVGASGTGPSPLLVRQGQRIVLDHISVGWSDGRSLGIGDGSGAEPSEVTVQHCLFGPALARTNAVIISEGERISMIGNLTVLNNDRQPGFGEGVSGQIELINNVNYGSWRYMAYVLATNDPLDIVMRRNLHVPNDLSISDAVLRLRDDSHPMNRVYLEDNGNPSVPADAWSLVDSGLGPGTDAVRREIPPDWYVEYPSQTPESVLEAVLRNAGARPRFRDASDAAMVAHVRAGTGDWIDSEEDVGGFTDLAVNSRTFDDQPSDPSVDSDGDGYTDLEEWLHAESAALLF